MLKVRGSYTKHGRLGDVLALIQVLALDEHAHRSDEGIREELQGNPFSSDSWITLAREHPEFFLVRKDGEHVLSLAARHVLFHEDNKPRPVLPSDFTAALLQTAISLHDRQTEAAEWWKSLIPLGSALIGALAVLLAALLTLWLKGLVQK